MNGVSEAWLRWRLGEEGNKAREWAISIVGNKDQRVPEQVGRCLHGLSATAARGPGRPDTQTHLSLVWKFLASQQDRAEKRGRTDESRFWQGVLVRLQALDKTAEFIMNRLAEETGEELESPEELGLTLVELYINTLLACWQAEGEHQ
jgi:hypothetical protein